jgi:hypothetical protein
MARKLFEKEGLVKVIALACLLLSFFREAGADPINGRSNDLQPNETALATQCGYALDKRMSDRISKSSLNIDDKSISIDFYLLLIPVRRPVQGKLSFSCLRTESTESSRYFFHKTTAADEISLEDSGGRYARNIVWQRKYEGDGWTGTIAYVDSVYGDEEKQTVPDYFFVCPDRDGFACFSLEIEKTKLRKNESDRIPQLLRGITLIDFKKATLPRTSGK